MFAKEGVAASIFFPLYCFRRLAIIYLIVCVTDNYVQVMCAVWIGPIALIILGLAEPFHRPSMRRLELFNESVLLVWTYFLIIFTAFVPSPEVRFYCGFPLIALVCSCLFVNLVYIHNDRPKKIYNQLKLWYIKLAVRYRNYKHKQFKKEQKELWLAEYERLVALC
jgi:hypothetical protein